MAAGEIAEAVRAGGCVWSAGVGDFSSRGDVLRMEGEWVVGMEWNGMGWNGMGSWRVDTRAVDVEDGCVGECEGETCAGGWTCSEPGIG